MPYRPRSYFKALTSLSRINLLHELQIHGSMTVAELAAATGLHRNTAREHLHRLIDAGFISSEPIPRASKGRPMILYRAATHPGDPARRARRRAAEARTERFHSCRFAKSDPITPLSTGNSTCSTTTWTSAGSTRKSPRMPL